MYTYLTINILTVFFPLLFSFEKRVCYVKKWKYAIAAAMVSGFIFVIWDQIFAAMGVWGFNDRYVMGFFLESLPLEEILFFVCIPFSCIFIYEVVGYFDKNDILAPYARKITYALITILFLVGSINFSKSYTFVTFVVLAMFLLLHVKVMRSQYLGRFYMTYLFSLIPFLIVNGVLTNGLRFVDVAPAVWYNNVENLSVRIMGIPIEDALYSMLLLLLNITLYEYFKRNRAYKDS